MLSEKLYFLREFGVDITNILFMLQQFRTDAVTTINPTVKPGVKLGEMNVRSVGNKLDYVFDHINYNNLDIVALTKTW